MMIMLVTMMTMMTMMMVMAMAMMMDEKVVLMLTHFHTEATFGLRLKGFCKDFVARQL